MTRKSKRTFSRTAAALAVLGMALGVALLPHGRSAIKSKRDQRSRAFAAAAATARLSPESQRGYELFDYNCASCHGADARGDEGPDLHHLRLSDERIAKRIREGVKGEMPRFGTKFKPADVQALLAYLRTLKD